MTIFIATYKSGKVILEEELPDFDAFDLETAYKEAKKRAKKNRWTVVKVEPKVYPPVPQITYPRYPPYNEYHDLTFH
jgi:hypothetical protein